MADDTPAQEPTEAPEDKAPETPEVPAGAQNPDAVRNALNAERKAARGAQKRAEAAEAKVAEFEEATQTETERLSGRLESLTSENKQSKVENLRLRIALDEQVPPELIDRLRGDTREEIEADAKEPVKLIGPRESAGFDGGVRTPAPEPISNDPKTALGQGLFQALERRNR